MDKHETMFKIPPESYWIASTRQEDYSPLEEDIEVDAVVVGGGLAGITTAYLLKREGLKVAVIEADRISRGTTGHTTAKITSQHGLIYDEILTKMGREMAQQYADANEASISFIRQLTKEADIDCDFSDQPAFVITMEDSYVSKIESEAKAADSLGIKAHYHDTVSLPFKVKAALSYGSQAQFHPNKYVLGLASKIPGSGSHIFEHTRALDIEPEGHGWKVLTNRKKSATGRYIIVASHYPFYDGYGLYFSRIYPHRSYIIAVKARDKFPDGMYITAEDPGKSLRTLPYDDGELLLVGGEHHKTGQGEDMRNHYIKLAEFASEYFDVIDIPYRWSAQDYTTMDKVPYAGRLSSKAENIFVATGFRKWGMTNSTASAHIIRDLIMHGDSPWAPVYSPSRFTPAASAARFVSENANVAANLISGKLAIVPDEVDILKGEAKIIEIDGKKAGVYKDEEGKLHIVNSSCTHMGCELRWNSAEHSWDCPCHGSRFTFEGEIVESPALKTIKPVHENIE